MESSVNSAIKRGYFQQVRFLIELGHNVNQRDHERRTPLMNSACVDDVKWGVGLTRLLVEKGAVMSYRDQRGMTALHHACIYDRKEVVKVLLQSPDFNINQGDLLGNTALHYVTSKGNVDITRLLVQGINKYSLKVDKPNRKGITALMQAWISGHEDCAQVLIEEGNADQTLREFTTQRSAKDFEEKYRERVEREDAEKESRRRSRYLQHYPRRPTSAGIRSHSALSSASRATSRSRPQSAILLGRRQRHEKGEGEPEPDFLDQVEKEKAKGRIYRSASSNDLRNKPEYIFNVSPLDFFTNVSQYQRRRPSVRSCISDNKPAPTTCWKSELKGMYKTFDFQFTGSYRLPAKLRESDSLEGDDRSGSPQPSDCDPASLEKIAKKTGRKIQVKNALAAAMDAKNQRKGSQKTLTRKSSSSLKAQQSHMDTSSCESVNSNFKNGKKRNTSTASDIRDDVSDVSSSDKSSKGRTRKISTTSAPGDELQTQEQVSRGTSPKPPTVKVDPPSQDSLKVIRE